MLERLELGPHCTLMVYLLITLSPTLKHEIDSYVPDPDWYIEFVDGLNE